MADILCDTGDKEVLDRIICSRLQQFLEWRKECDSREVRLDIYPWSTDRRTSGSTLRLCADEPGSDPELCDFWYTLRKIIAPYIGIRLKVISPTLRSLHCSDTYPFTHRRI